jgi:hypothetical protein
MLSLNYLFQQRKTNLKKVMILGLKIDIILLLMIFPNADTTGTD